MAIIDEKEELMYEEHPLLTKQLNTDSYHNTNDNHITLDALMQQLFSVMIPLIPWTI